jgi:hypothetical protein
MMTDSPPPLQRVRKPFRELVRKSKHRTSAPTDAKLRGAVYNIGAERGRATVPDAVILAALRLVGFKALLAEVERVEAEEFEVEAATPAAEHEPGA